MKTIALIPARYASSRFPGKLLQLLDGQPVIVQTYEAACATGLFDEVCVVTDHEAIFDAIRSVKGQALLNKETFFCGTDRIAAALPHFPEASVIVNVQGDEPFQDREALKALCSAFDTDAGLRVASLMHPIRAAKELKDPNNVKVVVDQQQYALLFSRAVIPYARDPEQVPVYYKHIGIYAFRRDMLEMFPSLPPTPLESAEKLEGLRYLEYGIKMKMIVAGKPAIGIDTPEDLEAARQFISSQR